MRAKWSAHTWVRGLNRDVNWARVWIERGDVGTLVPVTVDARQGQVIGRGLAAVLLGDDVVGLMRQQNIGLMHAAVLATASRPRAHELAERRRNVRAGHAAFVSRCRARALTSVNR